jgi:hypothetical protein
LKVGGNYMSDQLIQIGWALTKYLFIPIITLIILIWIVCWIVYKRSQRRANPGISKPSNIVYICDPRKNKQCPRISCYYDFTNGHRGACKYTIHKDYSIDGVPILIDSLREPSRESPPGSK